MKKGVVWVTIFFCFTLIFGLTVTAQADTLLFPVIAVNQPNVTTIVSVINRPGGTSTHLRYIYRYKDTFVSGLPNITGTCNTQAFTRQTFDGDVVSFDASGSLNSGNALFGDTNTYGGNFTLAGSGPRRAYLLVSSSDASGTRVDVGNNQDLGGEAILMDISGGAAWGYKAINDVTQEDYDFTNVDDGGGIWSALPSNGYNSRRFTFFPPGAPESWTTRFFITPIGSAMDSANLTATVNLFSTGTVEGIYDRNGTRYTFTPMDKTVTCTAAVDLSALVDSTVWSAVQTLGGWSWFRVDSGDAIVYKLEYVIGTQGAPPYGGTNNNGYLLSTFDLP